MSILIFMIAFAIVLSIGEAIESIFARMFQPRVKLSRPRQYKFN